IHRHPVAALRLEPGPAVVAAHLAGAALRRKGEADLEARRDLLRPRQGDEQAVEVGAVAPAALAGPDGGAAAPAGALLAVALVSVTLVEYPPRRPPLSSRHFLAPVKFQPLPAARPRGVGFQDLSHPLFLPPLPPGAAPAPLALAGVGAPRRPLALP